MPFSLNPRIIYRGTGASIFNECQMMGLQFGVTGFFQRIFRSDASHHVSRTQEMISATLGGAFTALFTSPVELVMIQQQRFGGNIFSVTTKIGKEFGFGSKGVFRGLSANIARDSLYVCGMLGVTPILQKYFMDHMDLGKQTAGLYASLLGGVISAVPSHPFDIVKTCMQGDIEQKVYRSFTQTFRALWNEGGVKRYFNGCFWRTINVVGTVYVANECRVHFPSLLFDK